MVGFRLTADEVVILDFCPDGAVVLGADFPRYGVFAPDVGGKGSQTGTHLAGGNLFPGLCRILLGVGMVVLPILTLYLWAICAI